MNAFLQNDNNNKKIVVKYNNNNNYDPYKGITYTGRIVGILARYGRVREKSWETIYNSYVCKFDWLK